MEVATTSISCRVEDQRDNQQPQSSSTWKLFELIHPGILSFRYARANWFELRCVNLRLASYSIILLFHFDPHFDPNRLPLAWPWLKLRLTGNERRAEPRPGASHLREVNQRLNSRLSVRDFDDEFFSRTNPDVACEMLWNQFELILPYGCSFKPNKQSKLKSVGPSWQVAHVALWVCRRIALKRCNK